MDRSENEEAFEHARVETRRRLARYDATGEYVADADVQAWLATWGSMNERRQPARVHSVRAP